MRTLPVNIARSIFRFALIGIGSWVLLALAWDLGTGMYWRARPEAAFRAVTGRNLPTGVHATAYERDMNDALFHTTHYWLLSGTPEGLRKVTDETGFVESSDARDVMPDLRMLFGSSAPSEEMAEGYEWERGHDRWYWIFAGETTALYAY